jgi:hypothetical protein
MAKNTINRGLSGQPSAVWRIVGFASAQHPCSSQLVLSKEGIVFFDVVYRYASRLALFVCEPQG